MAEELYGWRLFRLMVCYPGGLCAVCPADGEWGLVGQAQGHLHQALAPPAVCEGGELVDPHRVPAPDCSCGYYALLKPDMAPVGLTSPQPVRNIWWWPAVWGHVLALGHLILHEGGWRAQRYQLLRLFWPADQRGPLPGTLQAVDRVRRFPNPVADDMAQRWAKGLAGAFGASSLPADLVERYRRRIDQIAQPVTSPLGEVLRDTSGKLGVELVVVPPLPIFPWRMRRK